MQNETFGYALKIEGKLCFPVHSTLDGAKASHAGIVYYLSRHDGGVMTLEFVRVRIEEAPET